MTEAAPMASVVVPTYNARRTIRSCLEALVAQSYPVERLEIIIVDNNSTDQTPEIVKEYPVVLLYERDVQSSYAARNRGVEHARGEIVAFTDADCMPHPDWVGHLVRPFSNGAVVGAGGAISDAVPSNDVERFIAEVHPLRNVQRLSQAHYLSVVTANAAYRRSTLESLNGFDQRMTTGGDIELSWRIQERQMGEIVYVPTALVSHIHRSTPAGLYRQFRRYGYCSSLMTALYRHDGEYPQGRAWQGRQVLGQLRALATYLVSFAYRNSIGLVTGCSAYERKKPIYWFVAESGALSGRLQGMLETRFYRRRPKAFLETE